MFGLTEAEIRLAKGFFSWEKSDFEYPQKLWRKEFDLVPIKTVSDFIDYEYDNGHKGVYPLDTKFGMLRKKCGNYGAEAKQEGEDEEASNDSENELNAPVLDSCVNTVKQLIENDVLPDGVDMMAYWIDTVKIATKRTFDEAFGSIDKAADFVSKKLPLKIQVENPQFNTTIEFTRAQKNPPQE